MECSLSCATGAAGDTLLVCCDGLVGLPESINTVWPQAVIQTCVVHLLRASMRYASYTDRKKMAAALRPIYTAPTEEAAKLAVEEFRTEWKAKMPGAVAVWDRAWAWPGLGRVRAVPGVPGRDPQDHLHHQRHRVAELQLRKVTKAHRSFPSDAAALELLYLAIRNINQKRGTNPRAGTYRWTEALNAFAIQFPDRLSHSKGHSPNQNRHNYTQKS